jgi:phosphoglycolate phosphatase
LHDGVQESLDILERAGVILVAHTESRFYAAADRLNRLGLFRYFERVYCRERSNSARPNLWNDQSWLDQFPTEKVSELRQHESKPNPAVLNEICVSESIAIENAAYVGDSLPKDILMAKRAGMFAIWAAYGAEHDPSMYQALVRVTHWTPNEVEWERKLKEEAKTIKPDYVARRSFREVVSALEISVPAERIAQGY